MKNLISLKEDTYYAICSHCRQFHGRHKELPQIIHCRCGNLLANERGYVDPYFQERNLKVAA